MGDLHKDHHENLLMAEFESCAVDKSETLDHQGLKLLCGKLELEEKTPIIINSLLNETKTRVSFPEFRDSLLTLLNKKQDKTESSETKKTEKLPEREISPKFVFGKKKYGRRTRPKGADLAPAEKKNDSDSESSAGGAADVKKSDVNVIVNAQQPKKRRTALSDNGQVAQQADKGSLVEYEIQPGPAPEVMLGTTRDNQVVRLSKVMEELGIGLNGFINKTDLAIICDNVGMDKESKKVAAGIFNNLNLDENNRVSFDIFFQLYLKSLEFNDTSDSSDVESDEPQFKHNRSASFEDVLSDSPPLGDRMYSWEELELNLNGLVSAESVLEAWAKAGIADSRPLLRSLGFANYQVKLRDLVETLDSELSRLDDADSTVAARITFLTCIQALSRMELGYVKEKLEQANNELNKLRADIVEANDRASLLAQEVDENYTRMESTRKNEVKQEERRHLESVRLLTSTLSREREVMAQNVRDLEGRVWQLEDLDMQRRATLSELTEELGSAQTETSSLAKQLARAQGRCETVNREMAALVGLHHGTQELRAEKEQEEVRALKEKLQHTQLENKFLRDVNDELTMMMESLKIEIATLNLKAVPEKRGQGQYDKGAGPCCLTDDLSTVVSAGKRPGPPPAAAEGNGSNDEPLSVMQEKIRRCKTDDPSAVVSAGKRRGSPPPPAASSSDDSSDDEPLLGVQEKIRHCGTDGLSAVLGASKRRGPPPPPSASPADNTSDDEPLFIVQEKLRRCSIEPDTEGVMGLLTPGSSTVNLMLAYPSDTLPSGSPTGGSGGMQSLSDTDHSPAETAEAGLRAENKRLKKRVLVLSKKVETRNEMIVENTEVCEAENNHRLKEFLEQGDFFPIPQLPYTVSQITEEYSSSTKELSAFENTKEQLEQHCRDLKSQLDEVKVEIVKILSERNACSKENCALKSHISDLKTSLGHSLSLEEPDNYYRVAFLSESPSLGTENIPASGEPSLELRSGVSDDCLVVKDSNVVNSNDDKAVNSNESETLFLLKCEFAEQLSVVEENHMKEKIELLERCTNLESSIEMLRQEYEKCEDYWASKLEEERVLYDKEQRTLDKKYKKILAELKEYDEYLSEDRPCTCRRLATIQESEKLESQVTEMEEECEELRKQIANERTDRANEHQLLIEQLNKEQIRCAAFEEQSYSKVPPRSAVIGDIDMVWRKADGNNQPMYGHRSLDDQFLSQNHYMGHATTEPVQAFPGKLVHSIGIQWPEEGAMNGRQEPGMNMRRNPLSAGSADDLCAMLATRDLLSADISALRKQKELLTQSIQEEKNGKYGGGMGCGKQACCVDLTVLQTLNARWRQQEQQCRHLQNALKQRQRQTDILLQHTWAQHKKEISDLEMVLEATQKTLQHQSLTCKEQVDRLVRNDVLVKDLYVENAYLVATVQRLEQRCQGLAQMTTDSISV